MKSIKTNNSYQWSSCPLCKSKNIENIGHINYRQPIMFSTHFISLSAEPELEICNDCDSWFTQNIVDEKTAFDLYTNGGSDTKWPRSLKFEESKSKNILKRLGGYFQDSVEVLDIGCNTGVLLDYAKSRGCKTYGVEPSRSSQKVLIEKQHKFFDSLDSVDGDYDVVVAFDLVEHIYNLEKFLEKVHGILKSNGVLIILTGDVTSLSARLSKQNWWYLKAPEHIVFPSGRYLSNLKNFHLVSIDRTYASKGYKKSVYYGFAQYIRKSLFKGGYDGLSSLGSDHMLLVLRKGG